MPLTPSFCAVHDVPRALRGVVPIAVGVVPDEEPDALLLRVRGELFHVLAADLGVPEGVHEDGFPAHRGAEVDVLQLHGISGVAVHLQDPAPGPAGGLIDLGGLVLRLHDVPGDGGLDDGLQVAGDGERAPGRAARDGQAHGARAVAADFLRHREGEAVGAVGVADEPPAAVRPVHAGLAEEHPAVAPVAEQRREHVAVAVPVLAQGLVGPVVRLIAGRGAGEAGHGAHHRAQEGRRPVREHVPRRLLRDDADLRIRLRRINLVPERDVVRAHLDDNVDGGLPVLREGENAPVRAVMDGRGLDSRDAVVVGHGLLGEAGEGEAGGEVADVGLQAERRRRHERRPVIRYAVRGLSTIVRHGHHQPPIRAGHTLLLRHHRQREKHQAENQGYLFHHVQRYK